MTFAPWESLTLGDLGKWVTGSTPSSSDSANKGSDVLFVTPGDIGSGGKLGDVARRISNLGADRVRRIKPGSVILVCIGTIGKVAWTDREITTNQQINTLEVDQSKFDIKFVHWLLASPAMQEQLWQNSTSTTVALINKKTLEKIPCSVPPLEEQRRIAEVLDEHLSRLDKALAETQSAIAKATTYWHSMLHSLLFSDESGNLASTVELGSLAELVMGQAPAGSDCNKNGVGTPFVKVGEFGASSPEIREWTTKPLKMAQSSDVLICVVGATIGKLNLGIDCAIGRSVAAIRPGLKLRQKYLFNFLQTKVLEIRASSKGSAQGVITRQQLLEMPIPDLSLASQDRVIQSLETARSSLDHALSDLNKVSSSISTLRRSVLNSAFTGKLVTSGIETQ
jgi:restriction endonuclease S subunit